MAVTFSRDEQIAFVEIDNAPVNAIGVAIRQGLLEAIDWIEGQDGLERVVLSGKGRVFAAGADVKEFDVAPIEPHLPDILSRIEACEIPWIGAAHGVALGAGLELFLACRYRISAPGTQLGSPEVILGVVPGAGATQRLPRLVGLEQALKMISIGKPVSAREALENGLVDEVAEDAVSHAQTFDLAKFGKRVAVSRLPNPEANVEAIKFARSAAAKRLKNQTAPQKAIDLVELATELPFEEAMKRERDCFLQIREGAEAKALRHIFFAERGARIPKWLGKTESEQLASVVIVGGGTMGAAIAYAISAIAKKITLIETDEDGVLRANENVNRIVQASLKRGLISKSQAEQRSSIIQATTDYSKAGDANLAIEAAFESMEVKKTVFLALEKALPKQAILATNTSYLDIDKIAEILKNPSRLVGLHFFAPAHIMKLLEIVRGEKTSDVALATGYDLARKLGKIPVLAGVCDGFIGNRILARYREAADILLMDGTNPWELDEAMVEFGYAMGPYEAQDLSGLDIAFANRKRLAPMRDPNRRYILISDRMVEEGRLGRKTGVGWYRYPGGSGPVIDPLIEDLIREEAYFAKVERGEYDAPEIKRRLLLAMINEAAEILHEGIAQSASDIDLVTVSGYGFPRWRGGLMHYADQLGASAILKQLEELSDEDPLMWKPSSLIIKCANEGIRFSEYQK